MPIKDPEERRRRQRAYSAKYYANNRKLSIDRVAVNYRTHKRKWEAFKATLSCVSCGFSHPAAIDFHHTDPATKIDNVFRLIGDGRFAAAYREVKKCVTLCANCHRIHHYDQRQQKKKGPRRSP